MHKLKQIVLMMALLLMSINLAQAEDCYPPDFKDVNYSTAHNVTTLHTFSQITEQQYSGLEGKAETGMTIPYIDVPAVGNFKLFKKQLQQVQRLTNIEFGEDENRTMQFVGWTDLGQSAYLDCVRNRSEKLLTLEPIGSAFADEFTLKLSMRLNAAISIGDQEIVAECSGCVATPLTQKIKNNGSVVYVIKRKPDAALNFIVKVLGRTEMFALPRQARLLEKKFRHWNQSLETCGVNPELNDNNESCHKVICYSGDDPNLSLADDEEFLLNSAYVQSLGANLPGTKTQQKVVQPEMPKQVCFELDVNSKNLSKSTAVFGISVITVSPK